MINDRLILYSGNRIFLGQKMTPKYLFLHAKFKYPNVFWSFTSTDLCEFYQTALLSADQINLINFASICLSLRWAVRKSSKTTCANWLAIHTTSDHFFNQRKIRHSWFLLQVVSNVARNHLELTDWTYPMPFLSCLNLAFFEEISDDLLFLFTWACWASCHMY